MLDINNILKKIIQPYAVREFYFTDNDVGKASVMFNICSISFHINNLNSNYFHMYNIVQGLQQYSGHK